ncbi:MAG: PQQ-dependent sugar dehydrogenase [Kordiimonadaceae bacterium]|nr:PQQ-dependent sugar dehydrogenase [Kordiimonadaceae bacterium]
MIKIKFLSLTCALFLCGLPSNAQQVLPGHQPPKPAFPSQTRAPIADQSPAVDITVIKDGLFLPWGLAPLPSGSLLMSEMTGRLSLVKADGTVTAPLPGLPPVRGYWFMGLMDILLDPDFKNNRLVYFSYFGPPEGADGNGIHNVTKEWGDAYVATTALHDEWKVRDAVFLAANPFDRRYIGRGRLADDEMSIENFENIFEAGARRMTFGSDGKLWVTTWGSGGDSQDPKTVGSKMLRLNPDGSIPADNPNVGNDQAHDAVYAMGFRDPSGTALNPATGDVWTIEHGPQGGDEINVMKPGANYGWPVITYGREYGDDALPVGDGISANADMEQPLYFWNPNIAPSSLMFYTGDLFPNWKGNVFATSLKMKQLTRLELSGNNIVAEERLIKHFGERLRTAKQGYDGAIYIVTDSRENGQLIKITPKEN